MQLPGEKEVIAGPKGRERSSRKPQKTISVLQRTNVVDGSGRTTGIDWTQVRSFSRHGKVIYSIIC